VIIRRHPSVVHSSHRQNLALPHTQVDAPAGGLITDIQICSACGNGMRNMQFGGHITF